MLSRLTKRTFSRRSTLGPWNVARPSLTSGQCRKLNSLTMFHNPNSSKSVKMLEFLESVRTNPYPKSRKHNLPPLEFNLELHERIPTVEEFTDMNYLFNVPSFAEFVDKSKRTLTAHPTGAQALHKLVTTDPLVLLWPLVIDWERKNICIGSGKGHSLSIKDLLRELVWERDGTKPLLKPEPPLPPPPEKAEWIDYD